MDRIYKLCGFEKLYLKNDAGEIITPESNKEFKNLRELLIFFYKKITRETFVYHSYLKDYLMHCPAYRTRSIVDLTVLSRTYFPDTTVKDIIDILFRNREELAKECGGKYFYMGYCGDIRRCTVIVSLESLHTICEYDYEESEGIHPFESYDYLIGNDYTTSDPQEFWGTYLEDHFTEKDFRKMYLITEDDEDYDDFY